MMRVLLFALRWLKKHQVDGFVSWCSAYLDAAMQEARSWNMLSHKAVKSFVRAFLPITELLCRIGKWFIYISARDHAPKGKPYIKVATITLCAAGEEWKVCVYLFASTHAMDR